jgi:hypothetical protein
LRSPIFSLVPCGSSGECFSVFTSAILPRSSTIRSRGSCKGSILEMPVAIPCYLIVRRRQDCSAPAVTSFGIVTRVATMLISFGPSVLFLYKKRLDSYATRSVTWHRNKNGARTLAKRRFPLPRSAVFHFNYSRGLILARHGLAAIFPRTHGHDNVLALLVIAFSDFQD